MGRRAQSAALALAAAPSAEAQAQGGQRLRIFQAGKLVATHARGKELHGRIVDPAHWEGLWRARAVEPTGESAR